HRVRHGLESEERDSHAPASSPRFTGRRLAEARTRRDKERRGPQFSLNADAARSPGGASQKDRGAQRRRHHYAVALSPSGKANQEFSLVMDHSLHKSGSRERNS